MTEILQANIQTAQSLEEIRDGVLIAFGEIGKDFKRIGYVSGIITSDGPKFVKRNMENLLLYTESLRDKNNFPIFSAGDIFTEEVFERVDAFNLPSHHFLKFWREILVSGWVTDIFMTPRWDESKGALDEHEVAEKQNLKIHYLSY